VGCHTDQLCCMRRGHQLHITAFLINNSTSGRHIVE
jgi:hypothetical protein